MRKLKNTSGLAPLTPAPGHDLDAEQTLFNLYLREKARAEKFLEQRNRERDNFTQYRARNIARGIAKQLRISHNEKAGS